MDKHRELPVSTNDALKNVVNKLPIELTNITGTNLHDINDDCLIEIFSRLDLMNLCSLAETCTRFRRITQWIVPKKLGIGGYGYGSGKYKVESVSVYQPLNNVKRIFKNFGSILAEVTILSDHNEISILHLLTSCCDETNNLKSLQIRWSTVSEVLTIKLKPVFNGLNTLRLKSVRLMDDASLFAGLDSLVELKVSCVENCRAILKNNFPKLERFLYTKQSLVMVIGASGFYPECEQSLELMSAFISRHKNLKTLKLYFYSSHDRTCQKSILQIVVGSCKELEKVFLRIGGLIAASLQQLQTLRSLKALKLRNTSIEDFKFVAGLADLCELSLAECTLPKNSNRFASLDQITRLELKDSSTKCKLDVIGIIKRLVDLKELVIYNSRYVFVLDEKTFFKIVGIVHGRANVLTLKCRFYFKDNGNCDKNRKVRLLKTEKRLTKMYCGGTIPISVADDSE